MKNTIRNMTYLDCLALIYGVILIVVLGLSIFDDTDTEHNYTVTVNKDNTFKVEDVKGNKEYIVVIDSISIKLLKL